MSAPLSSFYRQRQKWPHCQFLLHVVKHDPKRYLKFHWWLPHEPVCSQSNDSRNSATQYRFGTDRTLRGESSSFSMKSGVSAKITELNCAEMDFQIAAEKPSSRDATSGLCIAVFHEPNSRCHTFTTATAHPRSTHHVHSHVSIAKQSYEIMWSHAECYNAHTKKRKIVLVHAMKI